MDKRNRKLKRLYKYIMANNTRTLWLYMLHMPPTKIGPTHLLTAKKNQKQTRANPLENGGLGKNKSGKWAKSRKG